MTDFERVELYYKDFDEWARMDAPSGKLEFEQTISCILNQLNDSDNILDLGGGPGRYTVELAKLGYEMNLADISEDLLNEAKERISDLGLKNVKSISKVNAIDLGIYDNDSFNVVLLMGPLYHLTDIDERESCLKEVYRVLKSNGIVIASYIPHLSGSIGIIDRAFRAPKQVDKSNLRQVFTNGIFNNNKARGFQEGYYPTTSEVTDLFQRIGFKKEYIRSVRGFGFGREEELFKLKDDNEEMFDLIVKLINDTVDNPSIIDTCDHALFIGRKTN